MQVSFRKPELEGIADGTAFPGSLSVGVAKALQAAVVSMKAASNLSDIRVFPHFFVGMHEQDESILSLEGSSGLAYTIEGDVVTITGVLATVRSA